MQELYSRFLDRGNFHDAWKRVAANRGCAGVDGETIAHFSQSSEHYLEALRLSVARETYRPLPLRQIWIPKRNRQQTTDGKTEWRELRVPTVRDRIVQQALLNILHPVLEPQFEPCSFAYRPGRSHLMAVRQVEQWRDQGYTWVLDTDIVQFFDQVRHLRLFAEIQERLAEPRLLELIRAWMTVGVLTPEGIIFPDKGVPQGAVISPILANVYLDDLDEALVALGHKVVRFADDFVVLAQTEDRIRQAHADVAQRVIEMGLQLHPEKTQITTFKRGFRFLGHVFAGDLVVPIKKKAEPIGQSLPEIGTLRLVHVDPPMQPTAIQKALVEALKSSAQPIPPPLFVVLGYGVRSEQAVVIESDEISWESNMSTLYLVQQGTCIRREQERFIVEPPREPATEVPIREVERILVFGNIQLTTAVISDCLELEIPVIFLTQMGEYKGHLWSAEADNLIIETAQFERRNNEVFKLAIARAIVQGKLWNSKQLLLRLNRKRQSSDVAGSITKMDEVWEAVGKPCNTSTLDQIRGYEGAGAAQYFVALNLLITHPDLALTERNFHPPKDPVNSLLSFGYTLLYNNVFSLLLAEGLNPHLGNLHGAERPKHYLAFDLMEEFRSPIVDTLVMKSVNQKIFRPTDFTYPNEEGGIYLEKAGRRLFLKQFEERICEKVSHPDVQGPISYRRIIQLQIQRYIKALLGNQPYEPFRRVI
jgi:CRISP-associated protein Cas1